MLVKRGKELGLTVENSVWFSYSDEQGRGFAELDHLVTTQDGKRAIILESKLTQTERAFPQLMGLYKPLVQHVMPHTLIQTVMVCQNMWEEAEYLVHGLDEVLRSQVFHRTLTWHWMK